MQIEKRQKPVYQRAIGFAYTLNDTKQLDDKPEGAVGVRQHKILLDGWKYELDVTIQPIREEVNSLWQKTKIKTIKAILRIQSR